jgi:hypothetical protein
MEERGGEEEGAAKPEDEVGPAGGGRGRTGRASAGCWSAGAAAEETRRGEGRRCRGRWGETEGGPARTEKRRTRKNPRCNNRGSHRGRRPSPEPRRNSSIAGDSGVQSMNRTCPDEALDETNAAVPSDSADNARIGSNCSPELKALRTSASNTRS